MPNEPEMPRSDPEESREEAPRTDRTSERETYERSFGEEEEGVAREGQAPEEAPHARTPPEDAAGGDREIW